MFVRVIYLYASDDDLRHRQIEATNKYFIFWVSSKMYFNIQTLQGCQNKNFTLRYYSF